MLDVERTLELTAEAQASGAAFDTHIFCNGVKYIQLRQIEEDLAGLSWLSNPISKLILKAIRAWLEGFVKRTCG